MFNLISVYPVKFTETSCSVSYKFFYLMLKDTRQELNNLRGVSELKSSFFPLGPPSAFALLAPLLEGRLRGPARSHLGQVLDGADGDRIQPNAHSAI